MKARRIFGIVIALAIITMAKSGHELPVYPSYYPHEIEITAVVPERVAVLLEQGKLHAYVGPVQIAGTPPGQLQAIESLGSYVVVRVNADVTDERACAVSGALLRELGMRTASFVFHPYPITPLHGDYLHHADLAEAAKARATAPLVDAPPSLRVRALGDTAGLIPPDWIASDAEWDAEIVQADAAMLMATAALAVNGWLAPPWLKTGWFHAERLLADAITDAAEKERIAAKVRQLATGAYDSLVERINTERDLVRALNGCRNVVAGYTIKREYANVDYSAGIENISYDSIAGFNSPMFIRTVKLKDFPWNGWLMLGVDGQPTAAWNPVAGMTDRFGQLMWFAVGDLAALPSPYESGWVLNRIAGVQSAPGR